MTKNDCLKLHDAPHNDLEYTIENVHHIIHLFKKRDFSVEYSDKDSLLKITTPFGKWKMLTDRRPIRILHINLYLERNNENVYHQQPSTFRTISIYSQT